jgi:chloride channel 3/4/5
MRKGDHLPRLFLRPASPVMSHSANSENVEAEGERTEPRRPSTAEIRRASSVRSIDFDLRSRLPSRIVVDENSSLLGQAEGPSPGYQNYTSISRTPRPWSSRHASGAATPKHHSHSSSWGVKLASAVSSSWRKSEAASLAPLEESKGSLYTDERVWYDQYTSTDWVHDNIADNLRARDLRSRKDIRGRILAWLDGGQGWFLAALVGCITACIAYFVDVTETAIFDIKEGYCTSGFYISKSNCCLREEDCPLWKTWGDSLHVSGIEKQTVDLLFYVLFVVVFAVASCILTLTTKTVVVSPFSLPTMDENLGADTQEPNREDDDTDENSSQQNDHARNNPKPEPVVRPPMVYYPAAGSGVAEVKVILSGFVVHGYLGFKTLIIKTIGMILSIASGLSLGKEGPFVHIATCVGNIACRLFSKYNQNDGKRREVLSASAAGGVAVAFGAPIAGVLFSLEEVSYYFPPKTLFRTFFCCIAAALSLKFLNPYGTGKIVIFEVRYTTDWRIFELVVFIIVGILGGALGALFIKASKGWARTFRRVSVIKKYPILEVVLVAVVTGFLQFWNMYTKKPVTELLFELASPCGPNDNSHLCPQNKDEVTEILATLIAAFFIKGFLTTITFGIKVPAGIYVPSMVVGGFLGRIIGHIVQYLVFAYPDSPIFSSCPVAGGGGPESCITPGVYALVAAGATMCGVTRLSVTLVVILFELTGSLDHVLPFSLAVLVAKWTADALEPLSVYVCKPRN